MCLNFNCVFFVFKVENSSNYLKEHSKNNDLCFKKKKKKEELKFKARKIILLFMNKGN